MTSLETFEITKRFGGLTAVDRVSVRARTGEILGVIGPNGAGKTTFFNVISGALKPTSGEVRIDGRDLTGRPPHVVARAGIIRTFQTINLFEGLTVLENVIVGSHLKFAQGFVKAMLPSPTNARRHEEQQAHARAVLENLGMLDMAGTDVAALPLGHKRRVNVAVALAAEPVFMLLDEPLAGLAYGEQEDVLGVVHRLKEQGLGVILVEHNVRAVMAVADRVVVLDFGEKIAEGTPRDVQNDPRVQEVYLGKKLTGSDG